MVKSNQHCDTEILQVYELFMQTLTTTSYISAVQIFNYVQAVVDPKSIASTYIPANLCSWGFVLATSLLPSLAPPPNSCTERVCRHWYWNGLSVVATSFKSPPVSPGHCYTSNATQHLRASFWLALNQDSWTECKITWSCNLIALRSWLMSLQLQENTWVLAQLSHQTVSKVHRGWDLGIRLASS